MNLEYLKTFTEVIKTGNFSEVAKKMGVSQPAISFQIQRLERDLGVRLIDRWQKSIALTEAGKILLAFAQSVEKERERLIHDIDQLREEIAGDLVITASTIPGEYIVPKILSEFKIQHPYVEIQMMISDSLSVISGVQEGIYEVGFCGIAPKDSGLESFEMGDDEIVLIVPPEHPFFKRDKIVLSEIVREPLIFREQTSGTRRNLETLLEKSGVDSAQLKPRMVLNTSQAVVSAVESGIGIAFVSNLAIKKSLALGLVKTVAVEGMKLKRDFFCVFRRERIVSRLLDDFINFVRTLSV